MEYEDKTRLARTGDSSNPAAAARVRAARKAIGLSQDELARQIGRNSTTIVAIEKGRQLPNWTLMMWFYNNHRIDINFLVAGSFSQLPADVQAALFEQLSADSANRDAPAG